ncbi:MAG: hypothetical protein V1893_03650 [Candidatus Omnitrophota bacterium]
MIRFGIYLFGFIELCIAVATLNTLYIAKFLRFCEKPVFIFVIVFIMALISLGLGIGILYRRERARKLIIFFSIYVLFNKIMIFAGMVTFSGAFEFLLPEPTKDVISFIYHVLLVAFFAFPKTKKVFSE